MRDSYPLRALQSLLRQEQSQRGVVTAVSGKVVQVATAQGVVTLTTQHELKVGQEVALSNGTAFPVPKPTAVYVL